MSLESVRDQIAAVLAEDGSGIAVSLVDPPESLFLYPTSWVNPIEGTVSRAAGDAMWLHQIDLVVFVAPRVDDLPVEFAKIAPLVLSVERAIWLAYVGQGFAGGISKCTVDSYRVGQVPWFGKTQHAVTFRIGVKEHTT